MRPRLWLLYSFALVILGVVLLATTGRAGIILIAGGVVGIVINLRQLNR